MHHLCVIPQPRGAVSSFQAWRITSLPLCCPSVETGGSPQGLADPRVAPIHRQPQMSLLPKVQLSLERGTRVVLGQSSFPHWQGWGCWVGYRISGGHQTHHLSLRHPLTQRKGSRGWDRSLHRFLVLVLVSGAPPVGAAPSLRVRSCPSVPFPVPQPVLTQRCPPACVQAESSPPPGASWGVYAVALIPKKQQVGISRTIPNTSS